ncbi:MAG: flagellar basal body P-ring formation chaperone FlgA [Desulfobacula sp.]|nr:flagellar basal body P-ring formation chaperone FlgA [Desulfobacula sp.]
MIVQYIWLNSLFADDDQVFQDNIKITIKETSLVKKSHVFLGDISDIHANGFLKEALEKIEVGSSPKSGKIKLFNRKKIVSIIKGQRYLPENIVISSPQQIYVKRLCQTISRQKVRQFVDTRLSQTFKNKEYHLKILNIRGLEPYPPGNIKLGFDSDQIINKNGKLSCYIDVVIDGIKEDRLSISGSIALYENVPYTKRALTKGAKISKEDICWEKKNIFDLRENIIKTFEEIDGKILKTGVRKGDYLKTSLLANPPLIKKGDIITLVAKNANLLIVTSGVSKEDGFENELIKVENLYSGRLVRGIVKEKSKVEVVY